jgi:small subunit ribosomal protein S20
MANHASALKRHRQSEKKRLQNRVFRNRIRTLVKKARVSIHSASDVADARETTRIAIRDLDMAASRGTIHPNNAARRKSRLMKQLAALEAKG